MRHKRQDEGEYIAAFPLGSAVWRRALWVALLLLAAGAAGNAQQAASADIRTLQARASADSNDPLAHYNLAIAHLSKKNYQEGEAALHKAIALAPQFAPGYFYLAGIPRKLTVRSALIHWRGTPMLVTVFWNDSIARWRNREARRRAIAAQRPWFSR